MLVLFSSTGSDISRRHPSMRTLAFQSAPTVATSIWEQQGSAIAGDAADDFLGTWVALSADAKTLVAGAPYSNNSTGYVKSTA